MNDFYEVPVRVHWADTDAAGIVWFGNYFRYFEEAEDAMFRALGHPRLELLAAHRILVPRVETSCRFRSPARAQEMLVVGIGLGPVTPRRITFRFQIRQQDTGRLVSEGDCRIACVRAATFEPRDFPRGFVAMFEGLPALIAAQARSEPGRG